jgi:hypothetical protein
MPIESVILRGRAKRAYELGRVRTALGWSIPTLMIAGAVAALLRDLSSPLLLGLALYFGCAVLLWWGRSPGRSVLPGVVYGLLPLAGSMVARMNGHVCMGMTCYSACLAYCVTGGLLAGLLLARHAARSDAPSVAFLSAAATALLTGAMGGSCIGIHGILGMAVGIGVGAVPLAVRFVLKH